MEMLVGDWFWEPNLELEADGEPCKLSCEEGLQEKQQQQSCWEGLKKFLGAVLQPCAAQSLPGMEPACARKKVSFEQSLETQKQEPWWWKDLKFILGVDQEEWFCSKGLPKTCSKRALRSERQRALKKKRAELLQSVADRAEGMQGLEYLVFACRHPHLLKGGAPKLQQSSLHKLWAKKEVEPKSEEPAASPVKSTLGSMESLECPEDSIKSSPAKPPEEVDAAESASPEEALLRRALQLAEKSSSQPMSDAASILHRAVQLAMAVAEVKGPEPEALAVASEPAAPEPAEHPAEHPEPAEPAPSATGSTISQSEAGRKGFEKRMETLRLRKEAGVGKKKNRKPPPLDRQVEIVKRLVKDIPSSFKNDVMRGRWWKSFAAEEGLDAQVCKNIWRNSEKVVMGNIWDMGYIWYMKFVYVYIYIYIYTCCSETWLEGAERLCSSGGQNQGKNLEEQES